MVAAAISRPGLVTTPRLVSLRRGPGTHVTPTGSTERQFWRGSAGERDEQETDEADARHGCADLKPTTPVSAQVHGVRPAWTLGILAPRNEGAKQSAEADAYADEGDNSKDTHVATIGARSPRIMPDPPRPERQSCAARGALVWQDCRSAR